MSRCFTKITVDNRAKTVKEWHFETGVSISTIESRRKRNQSGQAVYTPEEIVGLVEIKTKCHKPGHRINPKPSVNKTKERNLFQIRTEFIKKSLV